MSVKRSAPVLLILILLCAVGGALYMLLHDLDGPEFTLKPASGKISQQTTFSLDLIDSASKIKSLRIIAQQNNVKEVLLEKQYTPALKSTEETFTLGKTLFKHGKMELTIIATDSSYAGLGKGNTTTATLPFTLDTTPPRISLKGSTKNIRQGGSAVVAFSANETLTKVGVNINEIFFPAHEQDDGTYLCFFSFPYFIDKADFTPELIATDTAGNIRVKKLTYTPKPGNFRSDTLNLPDSFLERKSPEFEEFFPEKMSPLQRYIKVNRELRNENRKKLYSIALDTSPTILWQGSFQRLPKAKSTALFGDHRTYKYANEAVDQQTHLGVDLASIRNASVPSANAGEVVFAEYLGIYGEAVIVDHGLGLQTLYAHLSEILVNEGDQIERGHVVGKTGVTGLAGGDHLHFGILINGLPVNPKEWWDSHWIKDNIADRIGMPELATHKKK